MIIDAHAHVFPDKISPLLDYLPGKLATPVWKQLRTQGQKLFRPLQHQIHQAHPFLRLLPQKIRDGVDHLAHFTPIGGFLLEGTPQDLHASMRANKTNFTLIIAHPPLCSNQFVLDSARNNKKLIPIVNLPPSKKHDSTARQILGEYRNAGVKGLKIHTAFDRKGPDHPHYRAVLKVAEEFEWPVILHTEHGSLETYSRWFEAHPSITFVIAHLNFHEPEVATDLMEEFPNLVADTSWQPAEAIVEAVRRVGAERILLGSDWPLIGDNLGVHLKRINDALSTQAITTQDTRLILGLNAARIYKIGTSNAQSP